MWTHGQRKGLLIVIAALIAGGAVLYALNPLYIPDPPAGATNSDLADRIDPNTADADTLAVLPTLGRKRAAEIVAFRTREQIKHPGTVVFKVPKDLEQVHGIGPATVATMAPYLIFPSTQPAPAP